MHFDKCYITCHDKNGNETITVYTRNDFPSLKVRLQKIENQMEKIIEKN